MTNRQKKILTFWNIPRPCRGEDLGSNYCVRELWEEVLQQHELSPVSALEKASKGRHRKLMVQLISDLEAKIESHGGHCDEVHLSTDEQLQVNFEEAE